MIFSTVESKPPDEAYAAALCRLPSAGPGMLRRLLDGVEPSRAWATISVGHPLDNDGRWRAATRRIDVHDEWLAMTTLGVGAVYLGGDRYPEAMRSDHDAPAVLFHLGDPAVLHSSSRVGVVGTRSATRYGLGVAAQLGADLAASGVAVVSGLALGVDGAAHEGALAGWESAGLSSAPPIAVVAGGLDRPYPRAHSRLWGRVAERGVIVSEDPIGTPLERWRFPKRNRILAALSEVLIVVECHQHGGSLSTVRAAADRGVSVGAVPGSIRSPASAGCNDLLADGCFPVRDVTDVEIALDLAHAGSTSVRPRRSRHGGEGPQVRSRRGPISNDPASPTAGSVAASTAAEGEQLGASGADFEEEPTRLLDIMGWERCSPDQLLRRSGKSLAELSVALERLAAAGEIQGDGTWWERV